MAFFAGRMNAGVMGVTGGSKGCGEAECSEGEGDNGGRSWAKDGEGMGLAKGFGPGEASKGFCAWA